MKFVTSLALLLTFNASASPIKIYYEEDSTRAGWVKDIFKETYSIPEDLISLSKVTNCGVLKGRGKLDLCLKNNGDLLVVSVDRGFVNDSLKIFKAP